jgi:hypothetical protein
MATQERYRLKLSKLQFCSLVDQPAQPHARTLLIKRAPAGDKIKAEARFVKASDELGLAFFWAFTSTNPDGSDHFDLQGDNIDQEFIKAAMDFMVDGGGAVDEMHSNRPGAGRVVFAMPMTPEIAKAFGVVTKTSGLMIAIKPGADQLAKLKDGTYNGVSIGGLGEREAIKRLAKNHLFARVLKEAVLTSETDGHQHALDLDEPTSEWREMYTTSYQLVEGANASHAHTWTFDTATGVITLGSDSGHTHTLDAVVPPDVLAAYLALDAAEDAKNERLAAAPCPVMDDPSDGVPMAMPVEESSGATVVVQVNARAPQSKSTPRTPVRTVKAQPETKPMNLAKMLAAILAMTPSQQAHVAKLAPEEVEPFFTKSSTERAAILKSADDEDGVIFKGEVSGIEVRKSDGSKVLELAKQNEATASTLAKREAEIEKADIRKQAAEDFGGMPGDDDTHDFIVASLRKGGDPVKAAKAMETLTGMRNETKIGKRAPGLGGIDSPSVVTKQSAYLDLEKGLLPFCAEKHISVTKAWTDGLDAFSATPAGSALVKNYNDAKSAA